MSKNNLKNILIIGGNGFLGKSILNRFSICNSYVFNILNLDITNSNYTINNNHTYNYINISDTYNSPDNIEKLHKQINVKFDSLICVAGGFNMKKMDDDQLLDEYTQMNYMNTYPSLLLANLASKYAAEESLIVFTGADAVYTDPTPSMMPYVLAKTSVHTLGYLVDSERKEGGLLPNSSSVVTILPTILDTEFNREVMKDAKEADSMIKPEGIAEYIYDWINHKNRPKSGSYLSFKNQNDTLQTVFYN